MFSFSERNVCISLSRLSSCSMSFSFSILAEFIMHSMVYFSSSLSFSSYLSWSLISLKALISAWRSFTYWSSEYATFLPARSFSKLKLLVRVYADFFNTSDMVVFTFLTSQPFLVFEDSSIAWSVTLYRLSSLIKCSPFSCFTKPWWEAFSLSRLFCSETAGPHSLSSSSPSVEWNVSPLPYPCAVLRTFPFSKVIEAACSSNLFCRST